MGDYALVLARVADAPRLAAMSERLIESGLRPSWPPSRVAWHIRDPDSVVLTARTGDDIAGFAIMRYGDDTAHLNLLAVAEEHRRRGIARRLLGWLEETAITAGTFLIELELRETNREAYAFYAALGYRQTGLIAGYYQGIEHAICMARALHAVPDVKG